MCVNNKSQNRKCSVRKVTHNHQKSQFDRVTIQNLCVLDARVVINGCIRQMFLDTLNNNNTATCTHKEKQQ